MAWFHPQRGAILSKEPIAPGALRYRGGADSDWRDLARVTLVDGTTWYRVRAPGATLPKGFLWGDPAKQSFGLGGPLYFYGPLHRICSDCREPFVFTAQAQRHLYETLRAFTDVTAKRCRACARKRHRLERARAAFAEALRTAGETSTAASHLAVAESVVELVAAGGRTSLDKAIGHARRARKLGAGAKATTRVEARLAKLRAKP